MLIDSNTLLNLFNETIATAIVVIAASLLLYNLTRNLNDRVARTSAVVLGCMTATYLADVFLTLNPGINTYMATLRLQWIGIAFMPVALLHLSDALLATTGLPSRGRRRFVIRALYLLSAVFLLLAAFTDTVIRPLPIAPPPGSDATAFASIVAGPLFPVYVAYFVGATAFAFFNVNRARLRCITPATRRRMGYLQIAMLTPAIGIFPFSILLGPGQEYSLSGLALVIAANTGVILMLLFLAYPLSFFGSRIPDRIVKVELLRFILRGPATGLLALIALVYITPATRILGLPGLSFAPFAVIAVILLWQWMIALTLPRIERWLVYPTEDDEQLETLESLSDHLLSRTDLLQLQQAILSAVCDYLRVNTAFIGAFRGIRGLNGAGGSNSSNGMDGLLPALEIVSSIGLARPNTLQLEQAADTWVHTFSTPEAQAFAMGESAPESGIPAAAEPLIIVWQGYWITPLYSNRHGNEPRRPNPTPASAEPIGVLAISARAGQIDLTDDDRAMLGNYARRAARTLDDLALQGEILSALQGLLPQLRLTRENTEAIEFRPPRPATPAEAAAARPADNALPAPEMNAFREQVRAALRHYWGGPGLTSSRLLDLRAVQRELPENDNDGTKALRAVLTDAIERMKPGGERTYTSPEWTLYNILQLRFIKGQPVKEVAHRLALSEAHLYRKQNTAIDALADQIIKLDREVQAEPSRTL